jgi:hypothetical protein
MPGSSASDSCGCGVGAKSESSSNTQLGYGGVDLKRWLKKFDEIRDRDEAEKTGELRLQSSRKLLPHLGF